MQPEMIVLSVAVGVAGLYSTIESGAMSGWSMWSFKGPKVWMRETPIELSESALADLVQVVQEDVDIQDLKVSIKAVQKDLYLLGIPINYRGARDQVPIFLFLSGRLVVDGSLLRIQLHLMPGSCLTVFLGLGGGLLAVCLRGDCAVAAIGLIMFSSLLYGFYVVVFKRRVEDFWFLMTMKLKKLGY
jgi:hypothetical protein